MSDQVISQVRASVTAFADGIRSLPAKDRNGLPNSAFGQTYNKLLAKAKQAKPDADPDLWPPDAKISPGSRGMCGSPYSDVLSFAEMILAQLGKN